MRNLIALFTLFTGIANAETRVAVIDSGFGSLTNHYDMSKLCPTGHRDFSGENQYFNGVPTDGSQYNHGTNIVGIIAATAPNKDFCVVVVKYYREHMTGTTEASIQAIKYVNELGIKIINFSGGGINTSPEEKVEVLKFLNKGGTFVAAAGNEGEEIGVQGRGFYPAMYDPRIIVVGNLDKKGQRSIWSNYGTPVKYWEVGEKVKGYGITLTGTSQATAVVTGKLLNNTVKGK